MRVYLMRHGIAIDRSDPLCPPDPLRPLTGAGLKRTRQAAEGLRALGIAPTLILSSPYVRAHQTAELVQAALNLPPAALVETEALLPDADSRQLAIELRRRRRFQVMCVGHLPHLDGAIANLLGVSEPVTELRKAAVAYVDWPSRGPGRLVWLATAKLLRGFVR